MKRVYAVPRKCDCARSIRGEKRLPLHFVMLSLHRLFKSNPTALDGFNLEFLVLIFSFSRRILQLADFPAFQFKVPVQLCLQNSQSFTTLAHSVFTCDLVS